jgi:hypothetical protein
MLYPNPSNGTIYIEQPNHLNLKVKNVIDMFGKGVNFETYTENNDLLEVRLLENNDGLYQIIFDSNGQQFHKKIMIVK